MAICILCGELEATGMCDDCDNELCEECLEGHQHCLDCNGTGIAQYNVMRDAGGNYDYLHGELTGKVEQERCRRCEETGLRL